MQKKIYRNILSYLPIFFLFCLSSIAFAQNAGALLADGESSTTSETVSLFLAICKVVGSLGLVIALMVFMVYLLKRFGVNRNLGDGSLIKVIDNKMVAPKKYIAIVEIAGKTLSVGISDNNINLLCELDGEVVKQLQKSIPQTGAPKLPKQFKDFLSKATTKTTDSSSTSNDN